MVEFYCESDYIESKTSLRAKIASIDAIILALMTSALKAATKDGIQEYWLDDGQTKIKTIYKGVDQIWASINNFKRLKIEYQEQLSGGRVTRLVDGKNLSRYGR
jgi:peptidyl-tRNA hydrolase